MLMSDALAPVMQDAPGTVRRIGLVSIASLSDADAQALIHTAIEAGQHLKIAFANSHVVNLAATDPAFVVALQRFTILPDGIGVDLGSKLLYGAAFATNLNGTDFVPRLIERSARPMTIGLVGARPGVAERALQTLRGLAPRHQYQVFSDGFFTDAHEPELLAKLSTAPPDLLLVAFGNPRQELWIANKLGREHCKVAFGVGAFFDFLAGEVVRAPMWLRRLRLEWLFRLAQEPTRLWQRYVLGNPAFLVRVLIQKLRGAP